VSRLNRATAGLGLLALATAGASAIGGELNFRILGWGLAVTLVLGALAIAAGWLGQRLLALAAGLGFLAAAGLQIVQLGGEAGAVEHGVLGGNASTFTVWLGLGVGLAVLGAQPRQAGG
jgi:hypothetical protein